jgi:hypothetical protein
VLDVRWVFLVEWVGTYKDLFSGPQTNDFVYTYNQHSGHFDGPAYDGGHISVNGCSGKAGSWYHSSLFIFNLVIIVVINHRHLYVVMMI